MQPCIDQKIMERKLLHNTEDKISYLQIIGFVVILLGLLNLFVEKVFFTISGGTIAVDFFSIMMGMVFAYPDLLRDSNKGLSTMRLVVFMMINVICILLLKIGWGQDSLAKIGLDQYWMGLIAFVFGAKATQSYFESKLAPPIPTPTPSPSPTPVKVSSPASTAGTVSSGPTASDSVTPASSSTPASSAAQPELDGCGVTPTQLTTDALLPASKGGVL
jgi:hypothetical protein